MATITNQLQRVLEGRNSQRISISIEAEPGQGQQAEDILASNGIEYTRVDVRNKTVFEATVSRTTLQMLSQEQSIAVLDHNPTFSPLSVAPNDPQAEVQQAEDYNEVTLGAIMERLGVPQAWEEYGTRGDGVRFGMVDSPIDDAHNALADSVVDTEAGTVPEAHGTWVASALVANEFEAPEGTIHGGCPDAELVAHGALSGGGAGISEISEGVSYCIEQDVDILNLSFGGEHSSVLESVINEAIDAGIVVVTSIGNSGPAPGSASCPAHHDTTAAIGSIGPDGTPGAFSSRGPGWNGEAKPEAVAYGGKTTIDSAGQQFVEEAVVGAAPNNDTIALVGTSMAAPEAATVLGLGIANDKQTI